MNDRLEPPGYDELAALVRTTLDARCPDGFRVVFHGREQGWAVERAPGRRAPGEWGHLEWDLWITADREWLLGSYGNTDAGMGQPYLRTHALATKALRLELPWRPDPVGAFVARLFDEEPNRWGCS